MKPFEYLTLAQAAVIAQCSASNLRHAIKTEKLLGYKVGKTWLTDREALEVWMHDPECHKPGVRAKK